MRGKHGLPAILIAATLSGASGTHAASPPTAVDVAAEPKANRQELADQG